MSDAAPRIPDDDRLEPADDGHEPADDRLEPAADRHEPSKESASPADAAERPDWLLGADQAAEAERGEKPTGATPFRLTSAAELSERVEVSHPLPAAKPAPPAPPAKPVAWTAAASSIPALKAARAELSERAAAPPPPAAAPQAGDDEPGLADEERDAFAVETPAHAAPASAPRPQLHEAWWVIALDALRSNPTVQIALGGAVAIAIAAWIFLPRSEPGISLSALHRDAARWDGKVVRVHGKVGDVFGVGGGYAFYLLQGRDTIVVFTRSGAPETNRSATVVGSVSTGYLDGLPRQAIFEQPQP